MKLDNLDKNILQEIQKDACQSSKKISRKLGKPRTTIVNRIKRLEKEGVIDHYTAIINPQKAGLGFLTYFFIQGPRGKDFDIESFGKTLAKLPGMLEVHSVAGEYDYIIKARFKDVDDYFVQSKFLASKVALKGGGIITTHTFKETTELEI